MTIDFSPTTPEPIRLDTSDQILTAAAWIMDRQLDRTAGQLLSADDQDRALAIARRALLRLSPAAPEATWIEADDRELPAWLTEQIKEQVYDRG